MNRNLAKFFVGHEVKTAAALGWESLENGSLLAEAAKQFDVFITTDKKIRFEHNLDRLPIPVVELNTRFTRLRDLQTLAPYLESALTHARTFRFVSIGADGGIEKLAERTHSIVQEPKIPRDKPSPHIRSDPEIEP